jgi:hypothetical protein
MAIADSNPVRFTPRGLADAYDSTDVFPGACRKLANLVFDQSNPEIVVARPGVGSAISSFAGFTTPGFVSVQLTIGQYIFGMVATGLTAGKDQPFCYNIQSGSFITISGVTAGNSEGRPTSPSQTGAWTPPTIASIGSKLIITHPGYSGTGSNFFGVIDISNPLAPAYSTMNTTSHGLPSVPTAVANLNNRAYFACGNVAYYSDSLNPTVMTNAGQALTLGDTSPITALSGLPVQTTSAGVIAALIAFKSTQIWQITGDSAITGSLSLNYLSLNIGSACPRSIVPSPLGTFFAGPDSAYLVNAYGAVMPVTYQDGYGAAPDIRQPFGNITEPTRVAAAFAGNIYRICIPTIVDGVAGTYDYWFDTRKKRWNGPHSFVYDCASSAGNYFIVSGYGSGAKLFSSMVYPTASTTYKDNGASYNVELKSAQFPKTQDMMMKQVVESTIELSSIGAATTYAITAYNDKGNYINGTNVTTTPTGNLWGNNTWGDGSTWQTSTISPRTYQVNWTIPLVFNKLAIDVLAPASTAIAIGTFFARYQNTGYLLQA